MDYLPLIVLALGYFMRYILDKRIERILKGKNNEREQNRSI